MKDSLIKLANKTGKEEEAVEEEEGRGTRLLVELGACV